MEFCYGSLSWPRCWAFCSSCGNLTVGLRFSCIYLALTVLCELPEGGMAGEFGCGQGQRCEGVRDGDIQRCHEISSSSITNSWEIAEQRGTGCFCCSPAGRKTPTLVPSVVGWDHGRGVLWETQSMCKFIHYCPWNPKSRVSSCKSEMHMLAASGGRVSDGN